MAFTDQRYFNVVIKASALHVVALTTVVDFLQRLTVVLLGQDNKPL